MELKQFTPIYYFPFWRKQFYFHKNAPAYPELISFYRPYFWLTKISWFTWLKIPFIKHLFSTNGQSLPISLPVFGEILGDAANWVWVINKGYEGPGQKATGLFINTREQSEKFFLKYGDTPKAVDLIKNEIHTLQQLYPYEFAPKLIRYKVLGNSAYFLSTVFTAQKYSLEKMDTKLLNFMIKMSDISPLALNQADDLYYSFGHGDFCPWNLLIDQEEILAIDWEMGGNYILGYDLFTFVFQTNFLLHPNKAVEEIYNDNKSWFSLFFTHFGIKSCHPYLRKFASGKAEDQPISDNIKLLEQYRSLEKFSAV